MKTRSIILFILTLLLTQACERKPESIRTTPQASSQTSPSSTPIDLGAEAVKRAEQEWAKTWVQQGDKWIVQDKNLPFLLQIKGRYPEVHQESLSEADRLNGVEWVGQVLFSSTAQREFWLEDEHNIFEKGHSKGWNDWETGGRICAFDIKKKKGQWILASQEPTILRGMLPREVMRPKVSPLPQ